MRQSATWNQKKWHRSARNLVLLWGAFALSTSIIGCAMMNRDAPQDPFAEQQKKQAAALAEANKSATDPNVKQTSYVDPNDKTAVVSSEINPEEPEGWDRFSPENVTKTMKKAVGLGPNRAIATEAFEKGKALYDQGTPKDQQKFVDAAAYFATAADRLPDSVLEEKAMFMHGLSLFFADKYVDAEDKFQELVVKYPNSSYLDQVVQLQFRIANYWQRLSHPDASDGSKPPPSPHVMGVNFTDKTQPWTDTDGHAIRVYENIRLNAPRGPLADDAVMAAANLHFITGSYEEADHLYKTLRTDYVKSEHLYQAFILGLQCKLKMYQGSEYNTKPLEEANELIDQILVNFPTEARDERERLLKTKAEIKAQTAMRDWNLAQFYEKGDYFRAAKFYYQKMVKDYPNTPFATKAQERIAALQGKPDNPPDNYEFLNYIFGRPNGKAGLKPK